MRMCLQCRDDSDELIDAEILLSAASIPEEVPMRPRDMQSLLILIDSISMRMKQCPELRRAYTEGETLNVGMFFARVK